MNDITCFSESGKTYNYSFNIRYGKDCEAIAKIGQFITLPDCKCKVIYMILH